MSTYFLCIIITKSIIPREYEKYIFYDRSRINTPSSSIYKGRHFNFFFHDFNNAVKNPYSQYQFHYL